jgi:hypothetical protein
MTTPSGTGEEQNSALPGENSFTAFAKAIAQSPPSVREKLAIQLKKAGLYKGEISSKFDNKFYDALLRAEQKRASLSPFIDVSNRYDFIEELALEGGDGGKKRPSSVTSRVVSEPKTLFDEIDAVTREYYGRELPDAAKKRLAKKYIALQKKGALDVTTAYSEDGSFRQTTGGGVAPAQFFIEEISGTDEAKANKALKGYDILMGLLGGLR